MTPRAAVRKLLVVVLALGASASALAQDLSSKPIRLIVGLAAGSGVDALARVYAQKLSEVLNTPVYVENKPGAAQIVAIRALESSPPDGHTLYLAIGSALSQGPGIRRDLPYDPLKSFTFVAQVGTAPGVIHVHPDVPIKSVAELIAYAKANPGKLTFGTAGIGSAGHLGAEFFMNLTGVKLSHVPFKSDPEAAREVAAGTVNMAFTLGSAAAPLAEAGKLRPIMIIGTQRFSSMPNVPSAMESGVAGLENIAPYTYYGVVGPPGLPAAIVDKVNRAVNEASKKPDVIAYLQKASIDPVSTTPPEFRAFAEKEIAKWRKVGENVKIEWY